MQGRLLPKYRGRYQAHPVGYWQSEFAIAAEIDLHCIEFILDFNEVGLNPLLSDEGIEEIQSIVDKTGVKVLSICADYFMEAPLHSDNKKEAKESLSVLIKLIDNANKLGIKDIVIPCVDHSSLSSKKLQANFKNILADAIPFVKRKNVNLSLETDLRPQEFADLVSHFASPNVTVNYDIGNSASRGYSIEEEFSAYGEWISDIHIKDRVRNGGSVLLGTGAADFSKFPELVQQYNFSGPFIMQAYRDEEGLEIFRKQLGWFKKILLHEYHGHHSS